MNLKTLIFKIRGYVNAQIEFSAFHKNNSASNTKRVWQKQTYETLTHCLKRKYHLKTNLESFKWVDALLFNNLEQLY